MQLKKNGKYNFLLLFGICLAVLAVIASLILFSFINPSRPEPAVGIKADNSYGETLRVVTDIDYEPFSYIDANGEYTGLDVELITEIANRLGMNLDLKLLPWTEANELFRSGEADAFLNMEADSVAKEGSGMISTIPTTEKQYVIYGRKSVSSVPELYGTRIVSLHTMAELGLENDITYVDSYGEVFEGLQNGEYDYGICPIQVGNVFVKKMDLADIRPSYAVAHIYGAIAIHDTDRALCDRMNEVIHEMDRKGRLRARMQQPLTSPQPRPPPCLPPTAWSGKAAAKRNWPCCRRSSTTPPAVMLLKTMRSSSGWPWPKPSKTRPRLKACWQLRASVKRWWWSAASRPRSSATWT